MGLIDDIPGYREAIETEGARRELAYLAFPEIVCSLPVLPLTIEHVAILAQLDIEILTGEGVLDAGALELFLWVLSPSFTVAKGFARTARRTRHTWRFWRAKRRHGIEVLAAGVNAYIAEAFADSPPSRGGPASAPYASWIASKVDFFATEYGWSLRDIMALPVKVAFQQDREMARRMNPKIILFNGSDRFRTQWLAERNKQN